MSISSAVFDPQNPRRRYNFAIHGRSDLLYPRRRKRQATETQSGIYRAASFNDIDVMKIVHHENLLLVFFDLRRTGGRAPGVDRLSYRNFSKSEIAKALRFVSRRIKVGRYRPQPTRAVEIAKSGGGNRTLKLAVIVDRVVAKAMQLAMSRLLDSMFLHGSHGFRPQRSPQTLLAALERAVVIEGLAVVAQDDVYHCFDEIRIDDVLADYRRYIHNESVIRLIETILRGHDGPAHIFGIDQGIAVGPDSTNLRLHCALDAPLIQQTRQENTGGPRTVIVPGNLPLLMRYVDNVVFACWSVPDANVILSQADQLLRTVGLRFKGQDGPPIDLHNVGAKVQLLGFVISLVNGRLQYDLPNSAWSTLGEALEKVHVAVNPVQAANEVVAGWLAAYAPAVRETEERDVLQRVRMEATDAGFRELTLAEVLPQGLYQGRQQWEALREQIMAGGRTVGL